MWWFIFFLFYWRLHIFQGEVIHFIPLVARHISQIYKIIRHHIFRQNGLHMIAQNIAVHLVTNIIASQFVATMHPNSDTGGLLNTIGFLHSQFHFTKLYPVPSKLHHMVFSAVEQKISLFIIGHVISGVKQTTRTEWIIRKLGSRFLRHIVISQCQPRTFHA